MELVPDGMAGRYSVRAPGPCGAPDATAGTRPMVSAALAFVAAAAGMCGVALMLPSPREAASEPGAAEAGGRWRRPAVLSERGVAARRPARLMLLLAAAG